MDNLGSNFKQVSSQVGNGGAYAMNAGIQTMGKYADQLLKLPDEIKTNNAEEEWLKIEQGASSFLDGTSEGTRKAMEYKADALKHIDPSNVDMDIINQFGTTSIARDEKEYQYNKTKEDVALFDQTLQGKVGVSESFKTITTDALDEALTTLSGNNQNNQELLAKLQANQGEFANYITSDGRFLAEKYKIDHPDKLNDTELAAIKGAYTTAFNARSNTLSNARTTLDNELLTLSASNPTLANAAGLGIQSNNGGIPTTAIDTIAKDQEAFAKENKTRIVSVDPAAEGSFLGIDVLGSKESQVNNNVPELLDKLRATIDTKLDPDPESGPKPTGAVLKQLRYLKNLISQNKVPENILNIFKSVGLGDESWGIFGFDQGSANEAALAELNRSLAENRFMPDSMVLSDSTDPNTLSTSVLSSNR